MYNQLTRGQRYAIYLGLQEGKSRKAIARQINVHPSTVGREIKRNPARSGHYGRRVAQESADIRKERLPGNRRIDGKVLKDALNLLKTEDRSPMQISGFLSLKPVRISHETIYKRIRCDGSGELRAHCRHKMKYRHHVKVPRKAKARNIPGRTSMHGRPAGADGKRFGDWEMDPVIGKGRKKRPAGPGGRSVNCLPMARLPPHGKDPEKAADMAVRLLFPYRKNVPASQRTTAAGSPAMKRLQGGLAPPAILPVRTLHGRRVPSKTRTSLSGNICRKALISGRFPTSS